MEIYILDSLNRRVRVIDKFNSCIWTERMRDKGDFQLVMNSNRDNKTLFPVGTRLAMNQSFRLMTVETVKDEVDSEGRKILTITGPSLEDILDDRAAFGVLDDLTTVPKWTLTGTPTVIARKIFHDICVTGILDPGDVIANVVEDTFFPDDTVAEPADDITVEIDPTTVFQAIKQIAEMYLFGFRLVWSPYMTHLYWSVYTGVDRTSSQDSYPAVIFSAELDNLENTTELSTIQPYKNVAYVFSPVGFEMVYGTDIPEDIESFERRVLVINATDIKDEDPAVASAQMIQRGKEALVNARAVALFDGEISQRSAYLYGRDYNLGDLVEKRNSDGFITKVQITEQIMVSDGEGERSYPTLTPNDFITPGSWLGWDFNQEWIDMGPTEYWADQP